MSPTIRFRGVPVSAGMAAGSLHIADLLAVTGATADEVRAAFAAVAAERGALAERLRAAGREEEAAIIEIGALIAADAALVEPAVAAVGGGLDAAAAVGQAVEAQAAMLEALPVPEMAQRADDVRQVGHAVRDFLGAAGAAPRPVGDFILIRREVSPADLIELAEAGLVGAVSVAGGASSHAAIIARGLGVPMIAGADPAVLVAPAGQLGLLDADAGELLVGLSPADLAEASAGKGTGQPGDRPGQPGDQHGQPHDRPGQPHAQPGQAGHLARVSRTKDDREITVLCNVASAAETRRGLASGAAGVGLLRTEIPYTGALAWPTLAEHRAQLAPILGLLAGRSATVRLLDFSGDKIPPFLRGTSSAAPSGPVRPAGYAVRFSFSDIHPHLGQLRSPTGTATGLTALLAHPTALRDQLGAVIEAGRRTHLAILVPMVRSLDEVAAVRDVLSQAAAEAGVAPPSLGIMVELQTTAVAAEAFAPAVDFFSIGTNDLTGQVLGLDRQDPAAKPSLAAHPQVLELIARVADAGRQAGIGVSVCGDSAADPLVLPLLVGLGVRVLSVPAAQVHQVRSRVAELDTRACAALASDALTAPTADEVWKLVRAR